MRKVKRIIPTAKDIFGDSGIFCLILVVIVFYTIASILQENSGRGGELRTLPNTKQETIVY